MQETILGVLGLALVAVSLCFSAVQTREVARQSRINNGIGSATALMEINNISHAWHGRLLDNPSLRPYFFDGEPCPPHDPERPTVLTLAELLADVLECELQVASLLPDFDFAHSWHRWPAHMLEQSPTLAEVVERHPDWWPTLHSLQQAVREHGGTAAHPFVRTRQSRRAGAPPRPQRPRRPAAPPSAGKAARTATPADTA